MNRADEELKINLNVPSKTEIKKKYLGTFFGSLIK
jgi:hypothetical protein